MMEMRTWKKKEWIGKIWNERLQQMTGGQKGVMIWKIDLRKSAAVRCAICILCCANTIDSLFLLCLPFDRII